MARTSANSELGLEGFGDVRFRVRQPRKIVVRPARSLTTQKRELSLSRSVANNAGCFRLALQLHHDGRFERIGQRPNGGMASVPVENRLGLSRH